MAHIGCGTQQPPGASDALDGTEPVYRSCQVRSLFVEDTPNLTYAFPVKNETGRHVFFERVQPSCSCSAGTKLRSMELSPGGETVLDFDIDLRNRVGPQRFVCFLIEKGGNQWTYAVETTLYKRAQFEGAGAVHFGPVDPGAREERESAFLLYAESAAALPQDVSFTTASDCLHVKAGEASDQDLSDGFVVRKIPLKIYLKAPVTPGFGQVTVEGRFVRSGEAYRVQGSASWNVRTLHDVVPSQVYFGQHVADKGVLP